MTAIRQVDMLTQLQSKYFHFTIFTWEEADLPTSLPNGLSYLIWGREICPTTQKPHLQCYAIARGNKMRGTTIQKIFPTAQNIAKQYFKGKISDSIKYCKKDMVFTEFGEAPPDQEQGKRSDLDEICVMVKEGASNTDLIEYSGPTFVRNYRGINLLRETLYKPKYRPDIKVIYKYGKTGLGKTYDTVRVEYLHCFIKPIGKGMWFDGYAHEREVMIDEFRGQWPLSDVLQLLDSNPVQVEIKGGHVKFDPDVVILCSNDHPSTMYESHSSDSRDAFFRRLTEIHVYSTRNVYEVLTGEEKSRWCKPEINVSKQLYTVQQYLIPQQITTPTIPTQVTRQSAIEQGLKCALCREWMFMCSCELMAT